MAQHELPGGAKGADGVSAMIEAALLWGLPSSPVFLMMLNTMAKTPFLTIAGASGSYCIACGTGSLAGLVIVALLGIGSAKLARLRIAAVVATVLFEAAWIVIYAFGYLGSSSVLYTCTTVLCASCAALIGLWIRIGRSACPRESALKYSTALMGAFVLYTLFSILPDPIVVSYTYGPIACALLLWRLSVKPPEENPEASKRGHAASSWRTSRTESTKQFGLTPISIAAAAVLFIVLGAALAVLAEPTPPLGAFYGLGIASLALAAVSLARTRNTLRGMGAVAGPLAIAGLCSVPLFGGGTAFAFFLAGSGIYAVRLLASIESSQTANDTLVWRCEITALALAALCLLSGFFLVRIATGEELRDVRVLAAVTVALVAADALWRTFASAEIPATPEAGAEFMGTAPSDALWLARTFGLSPRETEVAQMLCENRSIGYICSRLNLATSTVKTHVARIYEKTGTHSKDDLQILAANERDRHMEADG